jgi:hypothetical protein
MKRKKGKGPQGYRGSDSDTCKYGAVNVVIRKERKREKSTNRENLLPLLSP